MRGAGTALALMLGCGGTAGAMPAPAQPAQNDIWTRQTLTGDWGGARTSLAGAGLSFDVRHTSFVQGLLSGTGDPGAHYGGKLDAFITLETGKSGLWDGGAVRAHLDYHHGPARANIGGAIFAANTALLWPVGSPDELVATSLYYTQTLSPAASIAVGKINPVDLLAGDNFYGGWGIDRFMNLIFVAPPSGLIPVVFIGGVGTLKTRPVNFTLMVFDPNDRTDDYFPGDLFQDGVNVSLGGSHVTTLGSRRTSFALTGLYSTAAGVDYSAIAPGLETTSKTGAYNINFEFRHNLQEMPDNPNAGWGLNVKLAIADGNPNYVQSSIVVGIGGAPLFFGRPQDSFGIAVFHYNLSDDLQFEISEKTDFRDEAAVEAYYNYAVTPWLHVTADIQFIRPATGGFDDAVVAALRTQIRF
jgi:porin